MAQPSAGEEGRSGLPAPYEPPWRRLAADLGAVAASLRLKLRELGRLNQEGRLPRPAFWPAQLAPLFWPLVLALALALLVAASVGLAGGWGARGPAGSADPAGARQPQGMAAREGGSGAASQGGSDPSALASSAPAPRPGVEGLGATESGAAEPSSPFEAPGAGAGAAGPPPEALEAAPAAPPLAEESPQESPQERLQARLQELLGPELPPWVLGLEENPAASLLQLRLGPEFGQLPEARRRSLAEQWLAQVQGLGFERLELLEPGGALLARPARVGSGMILLDSPATEP